MPTLGDRGNSELLAAPMKCEICDEQTATMWVRENQRGFLSIAIDIPDPILSCDDCGPQLGGPQLGGPQLGYKTLAPLEPVSKGS